MIDFNPEKYKTQIEESRKRCQISARFEEPDRVPISISAGGSYFARLFGYNTLIRVVKYAKEAGKYSIPL